MMILTLIHAILSLLQESTEINYRESYKDQPDVTDTVK